MTTLLELVVAYVDLPPADADHAVPGVVGEQVTQEMSADESGGSGEEGSAHASAYGNGLRPGHVDRQTAGMAELIRPDTRLACLVPAPRWRSSATRAAPATTR